jgi:GTP-binding protein HflX
MQRTVDDGLIEVLNKVDRLPPEPKAILANRAARDDRAVLLSALTGEGCDRLLAVLDERLAAERAVVELVVPHGEGAALAWLHAHGEVLGKADGDGGTRVRVSLAPADLARYEHRYGRSAASANT